MSELEVYERVKGTGEVELYVVLHEQTHACSRGELHLQLACLLVRDGRESQLVRRNAASLRNPESASYRRRI